MKNGEGELGHPSSGWEVGFPLGGTDGILPRGREPALAPHTVGPPDDLSVTSLGR